MKNMPANAQALWLDAPWACGRLGAARNGALDGMDSCCVAVKEDDLGGSWNRQLFRGRAGVLILACLDDLTVGEVNKGQSVVSDTWEIASDFTSLATAWYAIQTQ